MLRVPQRGRVNLWARTDAAAGEAAGTTKSVRRPRNPRGVARGERSLAKGQLRGRRNTRRREK